MDRSIIPERAQETDFRAALRDWLLQKRPTVMPAQLDYFTPLIQNGIISSLHLMEFILYLEQLSGREISVEDLKPGVFLNIDTVHKNFFGVTACE